MSTPLNTAPAILTEDEAAAYLRVSTSYLSASRLTRPRTLGPPFVRIGKAIRYQRADLDQFIASRRVGARG